MNEIAFPGFGLIFQVRRVAVSFGSVSIYWYGIILAVGFFLGLYYCARRARTFGIEREDLFDVLLFAVPLCILGSRLYYILFHYDLFQTDGKPDFLKMARIWDGGIAIYGAIIFGLLTLFIFCRVKHISFLAFADLVSFGLLIGQAVGRWGNFVNIEAYGSETTLPWRMGVYAYADRIWRYVEVHPTFLYESLWNLAGFLLLVLLLKKWRRFDGQFLLSYLIWYGIGRAMIEGLRADSLYFFGLSFLGMPIRTSQMLGVFSALIALVFFVWMLRRQKKHPKSLYVVELTGSEEGE